MNTTVSVVIPAYNAARFLAKAIESVLAQTLPPDEVLVVNDGSTDNTSEIASSFSPQVRCLNQVNLGLSEARNAGIREAKGSLIALLDADDYWLPEKLVRQVALLEQHPTSVACFTRTEYVKADGSVVRRSTVPELHGLVENLLLYSCIIGPPSAALIRRSVFDSIGLFDPHFSQCADWDMWLRLAETGAIVYSDDVLLRYLIHDSNMSRNIPLLEEDTFRVLTKFFASHQNPKYKTLKRHCYSNHWMILSGSYLHAGKLSQSIRCLIQGLWAYPMNITRPLGLPGRWLYQRLATNAS